jgi:hypothetical protein
MRNGKVDGSGVLFQAVVQNARTAQSPDTYKHPLEQGLSSHCPDWGSMTAVVQR